MVDCETTWTGKTSLAPLGNVRCHSPIQITLLSSLRGCRLCRKRRLDDQEKYNLYLDLSNTRVSEEALIILTKSPNLHSLIISGNDITDATAKNWSQFKRLTGLDLDDTAVTDDTIAQLARLNLDSLGISGCDFSETAVDNFLEKTPDGTVYFTE